MENKKLQFKIAGIELIINQIDTELSNISIYDKRIEYLQLRKEVNEKKLAECQLLIR